MADLSDFDLDRSSVRAWSRFQQQLAAYLVDMPDDASLVVEAMSGRDEDVDGAAPYVQFSAWGGDLLRVETVGNAYLDATYTLDDTALARLAELGWQEPTYAPGEPADEGSPNHYLDLPRAEGARAAAMATATLRDVHSVAHPAFLHADGVGEGAPDLGIAGAVPDVVDTAPLPDAVRPRDRDHLLELVDVALGSVLGHAPVKDDDGDIPVRTGSALVFVQVHEAIPVITLFSTVVLDVQDRAAATEIVGDLNRRSPFTRFTLVRDAIHVSVELLAKPFVAQHLVDLLELVSGYLDAVDDQLAEQVGGRLPFSDPGEESGEPLSSGASDLPGELATILNLDLHGEGLDPEVVLRVYERDRDALLRDIRTGTEQEISWRQSAEAAEAAGDTEEAGACHHEERAWEATVETLRAALRAMYAG